ncbi:MAG: response regulator transcription factor [Deltaproteobacteria bacterium]|nr:response regulator transcription factor [Deltaproteobacteria bacterium]
MKKILIIDDDLRHDKMMSYLLLSKGFEAAYALSGEEALEKLKSGEIEMPEVMLIDIMMPGLNGFETLKEMQNSLNMSKTKVMVVSAVGESAERDPAAASLDIDDYVEKPFSPADIIARINKTLGVEEDEESK